MPYLNKHDRGRGPWVSRDTKAPVRFYTPDKLGPRCPICRTPVPLALWNAGETTHPCCDPQT